jgi:glycosyltransferase involved in cell wall biosynthesis
VLFTDFWSDSLTRKLAGQINFRALRTLSTRFDATLAHAHVVSWNTRAIYWEARLRRQARTTGTAGRFLGYIDVGKRFATAVRRGLQRRKHGIPETVFFGYDTGVLETLEWCQAQGLKCVVGQMDPCRIETALVQEEGLRWPGWELQPLEVPEAYFKRREQEWRLADRVLVNSEFCRKALVQQGVPPEKLVVVPLCYEAEATHSEPSASGHPGSPNQPLRVLWLGQVILRKGIQYLIQAARKLKPRHVRFDIVGPVGISKQAVASAPANVFFHGRVTRNEAANWYRNSDVFVLPTLSDGFAITQLEAMAHGVPVIASNCCGDVVTDGKDGFIVPSRNSDALVETFERYLADRQLLEWQSEAALNTAGRFSLECLAQNLRRVEASLLNN